VSATKEQLIQLLIAAYEIIDDIPFAEVPLYDRGEEWMERVEEELGHYPDFPKARAEPGYCRLSDS